MPHPTDGPPQTPVRLRGDQTRAAGSRRTSDSSLPTRSSHSPDSFPRHQPNRPCFPVLLGCDSNAITQEYSLVAEFPIGLPLVRPPIEIPNFRNRGAGLGQGGCRDLLDVTELLWNARQSPLGRSIVEFFTAGGSPHEPLLLKAEDGGRQTFDRRNPGDGPVTGRWVGGHTRSGRTEAAPLLKKPHLRPRLQRRRRGPNPPSRQLLLPNPPEFPTSWRWPVPRTVVEQQKLQRPKRPKSRGSAETPEAKPSKPAAPAPKSPREFPTSWRWPVPRTVVEQQKLRRPTLQPKRLLPRTTLRRAKSSECGRWVPAECPGDAPATETNRRGRPGNGAVSETTSERPMPVRPAAPEAPVAPPTPGRRSVLVALMLAPTQLIATPFAMPGPR
ncbi:MAG: hypothetical protein Ct9H300mP1_26900 [Planctomycetaceae bacterium]|nr:MAG: hypothetical protein Ct9H300mP1_26900 [Planctomycetaceae bacterium]